MAKKEIECQGGGSVGTWKIKVKGKGTHKFSYVF